MLCSGYFLGCPQSCLTKAKKAKVAEVDLVTGFIKVTSTGGAFLGCVSVGVASFGGTCINSRLSSTNS